MSDPGPQDVVLLDLRNDDGDFAQYEGRMRNALESGDKAALLRFIAMCFDVGRAVPPWAQERFCNDVHKAACYEIKSWDEVFGRPLKKGKQLSAQRRRKQLGVKIFNRVNELAEAGEAVSKPLFERVGEEFGVSCTVTEEIYYNTWNSIRDLVASLRPEASRKLIAFAATRNPDLLALLNPEKI
jgi:hypothetical protein